MYKRQGGILGVAAGRGGKALGVAPVLVLDVALAVPGLFADHLGYGTGGGFAHAGGLAASVAGGGVPVGVLHRGVGGDGGAAVGAADGHAAGLGLGLSLIHI